MRFPHSRPHASARWLAVTLLLLGSWAFGQVISVPTFGVRGAVPAELLEAFMTELRAEVGVATGLEVRRGELITQGIAGSLEPEFTLLIAELDSARFGISGEIAAVTGAAADPYAINLIVVDAEGARSTDLIARRLDPANVPSVAADLASAIAAFTGAVVELPHGDAGLFVSSEPRGAQLFLDGVMVGVTSELDVAMLAPGRYRMELRKEGFLPELRTVELRSGDTSFVHVVLTAISGGSIRVSAEPSATVLIDDAPSGRTPAILAALPGSHRVTLRRDGFEEETFDVLVRNYRVTRLEAKMTPAVDPLVYWDEAREHVILVDGVLQAGGYAEGLTPGRHTFELSRLSDSKSYVLDVPESGVYRLDLTTGQLTRRD